MASGFTFQLNADRSFESWAPEVQAAVRTAAEEAAVWYNDCIQAEEENMLKEIEAKGMTVIRLDRSGFEAKEVVEEFPDPQNWHPRMVEAG